MKRLVSFGRPGWILASCLVACAVDVMPAEDVGAQTAPLLDLAAIAARFAPVVYFDQVVPGDSGKQSKCLPQSAEPYYVARLHGDKSRICNQDIMSLSAAPSYYETDVVSESVFVTYWFFYGYQSTCFADAGGHDSDWERITVRIAGDRLHDVVYWQHDGRYTRRADTIRTEGEHPVAYSGKNAHGSYHDTGGSGGCLYFEDYRNPGARSLKWETWRNLKEIARGEESWMRAPPETDALWQGPEPPTHRGRSIDDRVCREDAGRVALGALTLSATNTCKRSDYADDDRAIRSLAFPPWRQPDCAEDGSASCAGARACFYGDTDRRGAVACYPAGDFDWIGSDLNDRFSSVRFFGGASATVFEHAGFGGKSRAIGADVGNFKSIGWNDSVSSLRVRGP